MYQAGVRGEQGKHTPLTFTGTSEYILAFTYVYISAHFLTSALPSKWIGLIKAPVVPVRLLFGAWLNDAQLIGLIRYVT